MRQVTGDGVQPISLLFAETIVNVSLAVPHARAFRDLLFQSQVHWK